MTPCIMSGARNDQPLQNSSQCEGGAPGTTVRTTGVSVALARCQLLARSVPAIPS